MVHLTCIDGLKEHALTLEQVVPWFYKEFNIPLDGRFLKDPASVNAL